MRRSFETHLSCLAGLFVASLALPAHAASPARAAFTIPAYAYDRGANVRVRLVGTTPWTDTEPMLHCTGRYPAQVEYDVDLPVTATYTLSICYAAANSRPLEFAWDGKEMGSCCGGTTGGWNTSQARWQPIWTGECPAGKHSLRLSRDAGFPHLVSLRFESSAAFPADWKVHRPQAQSLPSADGSDASRFDMRALRLAIEDLQHTFGDRYPRGDDYLRRLERLTQAQQVELASLAREALLANPLLDFDRLLLVKRSAGSPHLGLPQNWQSNSSLPKTGFDDSLETLAPVQPGGQLTTLFRPAGGRFVGDVDLHFDADRLLFSMPDERNRWQVYEVRVDGTGLRPMTGEQPDVDSYDACYLPNGQIIFSSTACFQAVPCTGSDDVAVLYVMDADGKHIRQLCYDQDHDWCPTVLNNGRVLYSRWEYTDLVHCHSRRLFHMNPDGTEQMAYYGSNSYWPNAIFYARPLPQHPTKVVAVISGHHGVPRMGELVIFDPARGRQEADGAVQRIPGHGKRVAPVMKDQLADESWPKFLHPYPLSDKYFLVSAQPNPQAHWGIYLVDVFDNMVLVKESPGQALFEPIPLRPTLKPPVVPSKVDLQSRDAVVAIQDIYAGPGLRGIPRGTVRALRVFSYHFAYRGMVTNPNTIGVDGPWDIKRVLGTVPVEADGSARFRIPAHTPISLQPLDAEGQALQLMRSWLTAMPGEQVSCIGCHEHPNTAPLPRPTLSDRSPPLEITPWFGPVRGFSYRREVQPVIDRYCVACHDGGPAAAGTAAIPDLRGDIRANDYATALSWQRSPYAGRFSVGYVELQRFVRRPGAESDLHLLEPMEFHADTTILVQLLRKGHHGVRLDQEAWDRLITWIDLNCPFHGTRHEELVDPGTQRLRRRELQVLYGGEGDDAETIPTGGTGVYNRGKPPPMIVPASPSTTPACPGWPFDASEATRRQQAAGSDWRRTINVVPGIGLNLVLVPAGEFVMGQATGALDLLDDGPQTRVRIARPFWMSTIEITNGTFQVFSPGHDSRVESKNATQYGVQGYPLNRPEQPVVRVSWDEAMAFCRWLSNGTGRKFSLPTEAQWEYAARAGASSPFYFGVAGEDFSTFANLADAKLADFASDVWDNAKPLAGATRYDEWFPKDPRFNDGAMLSVAPGRYRPNAWGLHDMHGNVAEWTRSSYRSFPYAPADGRDDPNVPGKKVARGGSWLDCPHRATAAYRLAYQPYQRVFNVGFRVVCEE